MSDLNIRQWPVNETVAAAVLVVASFLPWGVLPLGALTTGMSSPDFWHALSVHQSPGGYGSNAYFIITAWNGKLPFIGLIIPDWLVMVAGVGVAVCAWLRELAEWRPGKVCAIVLAAYGLLHMGCVAALIMLAPTAGHTANHLATFGIGSIITFVTLAFLLWMTLRRGTAEGSAPLRSLSPDSPRRLGWTGWGMGLMLAGFLLMVMVDSTIVGGTTDHSLNHMAGRIVLFFAGVSWLCLPLGALLLAQGSSGMEIKKVRPMRIGVMIVSYALLGYVAQAAMNWVLIVMRFTGLMTNFYACVVVVGLVAIVWLAVNQYWRNGAGPRDTAASLTALAMMIAPAVVLVTLGTRNRIGVIVPMGVWLLVALTAAGGLLLIHRLAVQAGDAILKIAALAVAIVIIIGWFVGTVMLTTHAQRPPLASTMGVILWIVAAAVVIAALVRLHDGKVIDEEPPSVADIA